VYLDRKSGRPVSVPPEMIAAFAPEGDVSIGERDRFPAAPHAPPGIYLMTRLTEWRDIDAAGHVNNATYLNYMEEAAIRHARASGWSMERMQAAGFVPVARSHRIEYRAQASLGEEVTVSTFLSDVRRTSAVRHFIVARSSDGEVLAQARSLWLFVNLKTNTIVRISSDFIADFAASIAEG